MRENRQNQDGLLEIMRIWSWHKMISALCSILFCTFNGTEKYTATFCTAFTNHVLLDQMFRHFNIRDIVKRALGWLQPVPPWEQLQGQELPQSKPSTLIKPCLSAAFSMLQPMRDADRHLSVAHSFHFQVSPNQTVKVPVQVPPVLKYSLSLNLEWNFYIF